MDKELIDQLWSRALRESIENGEQFTRYRFAQMVFELGVKDGPDYKHGFADGAFEEREACAKKVGEFAQKWWSIHSDSNKHMETTLKAHNDFCALQSAIRARGNG